MKDKISYKKGKSNQFLRDRKGFKRYDIVEGESELTTPYLHLNSLNSYGLTFDSSIPFLVFVFYTKTHHLSPSQYNNPLSNDRKKLQKEIFRLKEQGLGYKRIHRKLVEKGFQIGKSPTTVDSIIKKRIKRDEFLNQPVIEEYRNFDIEFVYYSELER